MLWPVACLLVLLWSPKQTTSKGIALIRRYLLSLWRKKLSKLFNHTTYTLYLSRNKVLGWILVTAGLLKGRKVLKSTHEMHTHTCTHTRARARTHTHTWARAHTHTHTHTYIKALTFTFFLWDHITMACAANAVLTGIWLKPYGKRVQSQKTKYMNVKLGFLL